MRAAVLCVFLFLLAACASSPDGAGSSDYQYLITKEQIADLQVPNLFDVIDHYYPNWMSESRSSPLSVVDDDLVNLRFGALTGTEYLKMRGTAGVHALELLRGTRPGSVGGKAVIIRTKPRGRT